MLGAALKSKEQGRQG